MKWGPPVFIFVSIALHTIPALSSEIPLGVKRAKREVCQNGVYDQNGVKCCKCPPGYYVKEHCNQVKNTTCEVCGEGTYYGKPNSGTECERCRSCNANVHQETEVKCTKLQDAKCRCFEGYWGVCQDTCQCHDCDKCVNQEIVVPCTATNNTVCREPPGDSQNHWVIPVTVVLVLLLLVPIFFAFVKWRNCFTGVDEEKPKPVSSVPAVDISQYLYDIVDEVGPQLIRELAIGAGVKDARIEMHDCEHPQNARQQSYSILKDWYETTGLEHAYPNLIAFLQKRNQKAKVEKLNSIILKPEETNTLL